MKKLESLYWLMTDKIEFEAPAYQEGETQRYTFNGEGITVLAFFPGAFTGVCTEEMCNFRDSMAEFKEMDAEVLGISVDTPFALEEFAEKNDLNFTMVSDTSKEISEQYGVKAAMPGLEYEIATRAVFVVKDGEVVYSEVLEDPSNLPNMDQLKNSISNL
jgi:peroxiredoxin